MTRPYPAPYRLWPSLTLGGGAFLAGVMAVWLWAGGDSLAGAVALSGWAAEARGQHVIEAPESARIKTIHVKEGDHVASGTPLIELDDAELRREIDLTNIALCQYQARQIRAEAERDNISAPDFGRFSTPECSAHQRALFLAGKQAIDLKRAAIRAEAAEIEASKHAANTQQDMLSHQITDAEAELAAQEYLNKRGLGMAPKLRAARYTLSQLRQAHAQAEADIARLTARLSRLDRDEGALPLERARLAEAELQELAQAIPPIEARRDALLARQDALTLRAPESGVIHQMASQTPGRFLRAGEPALSLIPQGAEILIEAQIPPHLRMRLKAGQEAEIHPPQTEHPLSGRLLSISPDLIQSDGHRFYRARFSVAEPLPLGVPVQVFVKTRDQGRLASLLTPLRHLIAPEKEGNG